jgi:alpha-tubulin suppressor-like RCC1 family protein
MVPVQVQDLTGVVALAGGRQFALALKSDGTVWAWGAGGVGQLGNDGNTAVQSTPVQVTGLSGVVSIAAGAADGMALRSDGTVEMWGYNGDGEVGNNNAPNDVYVPTTVFSGATSIAAGYSDSFAIKQGGTLWAWGSDTTGDLGIGSQGDQRNAPVLAPSLRPVIAIAAGLGSTIALS